MSLRDFGLLILICLAWAGSNIVSKLVVAQWGVPPLYYAAVRFALVAAITLPWLLPAPRPTWRMVLVSLLMGGGNFALLFMGFQTASPSAAAVVIQLGVPFTIVETTAPRDVLEKRLGHRPGEPENVSDADHQVLRDQVESAQGLDPAEREHCVSVDTAADVDLEDVARRVFVNG